jgi:hypothetical protein
LAVPHGHPTKILIHPVVMKEWAHEAREVGNEGNRSIGSFVRALAHCQCLEYFSMQATNQFDQEMVYIETHDKNYMGHFHLRRAEFTPQNLSIEFDRPADNLVSVTFAMAASDFEEASRVVKIISGEIELP